MSFKKINPELLAILAEDGITAPNEFQAKTLPIIKQGADLFAIGPKGCGKTTTMLLAILHKLNFEAFEDAPRALILVKDKEAALALEEKIVKITKYNSDIRTYCAYEQKLIEHQKDEIYYGVDIVIATPKRLSKLYFLNSINLNKIQTFCVHDADFIIRKEFHTDIARISESLTKCQHLIFGEAFNSKMAILNELIMPKARKIIF
ncbi:DEAD/DEAH box helicase [Putridiphycobacter roseus]|uniref:DEAD/DEAH box helicase n=1 Tax=Putridiphycobacter roseus TaxID=2219161 RepID=A0A2W1MZ27_9FLAO|nr:DEAD/DEAH box helicase [Putridiphycobacter roseus]PZE16644.1 DEAD/DEAH box helicase [Putridiphycobacter roseus]